MGKLGDYRYPTVVLSEAIKVAEVLVKQFRGAMLVSGLAQALNMSEKGGGFLNKMAALRDYGLVEGRGTLRVTPLAERIILPNSPAEAARAACEAFLRVDLFTELDRRLGDEVPDIDRLAIFLGEIARDRIQARRQARTIRRYYADYVTYLRNANATHAWDDTGLPAGGDDLPARRDSAAEQIELKAGTMHLKLPMSVASIEVVEGALSVLRTQLLAEDATSSARSERPGDADRPPDYMTKDSGANMRGDAEGEQTMVGNRG